MSVELGGIFRFSFRQKRSEVNPSAFAVRLYEAKPSITMRSALNKGKDMALSTELVEGNNLAKRN